MAGYDHHWNLSGLVVQKIAAEAGLEHALLGIFTTIGERAEHHVMENHAHRASPMS